MQGESSFEQVGAGVARFRDTCNVYVIRAGREAVLKHVGVEPTGEAFNSIVLDEVANRPFNPMVNAGAIALAELMQGATQDRTRPCSIRNMCATCCR